MSKYIITNPIIKHNDSNLDKFPQIVTGNIKSYKDIKYPSEDTQGLQQKCPTFVNEFLTRPLQLSQTEQILQDHGSSFESETLRPSMQINH